ncbi:MAG: hypothetical protein R2712_22380 [Vicinamibacterales bacterium]
MVPALLSLFAILLHLSTGAAQPAAEPPYDAAVRSYQRTGGLTEASAALDGWTRDDFETAVDTVMSTGDEQQLESAAVFHLEVAVGLAPASPDGAMLHVRLGERLVANGLLGARTAGAEDGVFAARWFSAAASVFLAQTDTVRSRAVVERALRVAPAAAYLHVVAGEVEELEALQQDGDIAQDGRGSQRRMLIAARASMEALARLSLAERAYRQAVRLDPALVRAQVRLGRVLFLRDEPEATAWLERGLAAAGVRTDRVLALLFLSDARAHAGRGDDARGLLAEARALAPGAQAPWLALAQLEELSGHPAAARSIVREALTTAAPVADDPWIDYRGGALNQEALAWLRSRVRR